MFQKLALLKGKGYKPDLILDIGAYHGHWTDDMNKIYPGSKYLLYEAIDYNELNKFNNSLNIKKYNCLLSDKVEEVNWYEQKNTGDSMFREKTKHFINCSIIKRSTIDLNSHESSVIINNESIKNVFIKIDCQGAEIPILKGATNFFNKTDFILLEIPLFGQYNEGVPNFLEHIKYMDSIGFIVYDMLENHYANDFCFQVDVLFINKTHPFNELVNKSFL
jgi:FkbM family methyltransferase